MELTPRPELREEPVEVVGGEAPRGWRPSGRDRVGDPAFRASAAASSPSVTAAMPNHREGGNRVPLDLQPELLAENSIDRSTLSTVSVNPSKRSRSFMVLFPRSARV